MRSSAAWVKAAIHRGSLTEARSPVARALAQTRRPAPVLACARPRPQAPYDGPPRAVIVVPHTGDGVELARWTLQCTDYCTALGYALLGLVSGDWGGARRMILDGVADVIVVPRADRIEPPDPIRIEVAELAVEPAGHRPRRTAIAAPSVARAVPRARTRTQRGSRAA